MPLEHLLFLTSQESQAIPLVSVASVAAGKVRRQACCVSEDRLERPLRPQESCDPGTAPKLASRLSPGLLPTPATSPVTPSLGELGFRGKPFGEQIPSFMPLRALERVLDLGRETVH